ncbi:MAG: hypothetical protein K2I27_08250, partial [Bacteroides sp.]|nr:hypothetical protein [Bacteroides sp.]
SDKLHSLGPKNVRRTSEETPKKLWSGKGPEKTQAEKADDDGILGRRMCCVNNYDYRTLWTELLKSK